MPPIIGTVSLTRCRLTEPRVRLESDDRVSRRLMLGTVETCTSSEMGMIGRGSRGSVLGIAADEVFQGELFAQLARIEVLLVGHLIG